MNAEPSKGWLMDPETGEPCVWQFDEEGEPYVLEERMQGCQTEQQAKDEAILDAIWQKLYDNPSLDPELWEQMFGPEPEYTEEEIEEMEKDSIEYGSEEWNRQEADSKRRWELLEDEELRRLHAGEPRLTDEQVKAVIVEHKDPSEVWR